MSVSGKQVPETILRWSSFLELEERDVNCQVLSRKYSNSSMAAEVCHELLNRKEKCANVVISTED